MVEHVFFLYGLAAKNILLPQVKRVSYFLFYTDLLQRVV